MKEIQITTAYITLQQLLKLAQVISSGGMVKTFLQEEKVMVNGQREIRRGRKLYSGDVVEVNDFKVVVTMRAYED